MDNINDSVVVGGRVFMHDGYTEHDPAVPPNPPLNPDNHFECNYFDKVMSSSLLDEEGAFDFTNDQAIFKNLESMLLCPATKPSPSGQHFYIDGNHVAIGDVNVWGYTEYPTKDKKAGDAYAKAYPNEKFGVSVETTHGLIYSAARQHNNNQNPPFIFVCGIVDRFGKFGDDVNPKVYAQNVSGAHNAGAFIAYLLSGLL